MNVSSQLERAQLENLSSDPSAATKGRVWWRTDTNLLKVDDGSTIRTIVDLTSTQTLTNKTFTLGSSTNKAAYFDGSNNLAAETSLATTRGGTGLTSLTAGDILYASASNVLSKLAKGSDGQVLKLASGLPSWAGTSAILSVAAKANADSPYTILNSNDVITVDTSGGAVTLVLPDCATNSGKVFKIKKITSDLTAVTINKAGSDTIQDAGSAGTSTTLNTQGEEIEIVSFGSTVWQVISRRIPSVWTTFTMTVTAGVNPVKGTTSRDAAKWRRVGSHMEIRWDYVQTAGGTGGTGQYQYAMPSGATIDTAVIPASNDASINVGTGRFSNAAAFLAEVSNPCFFGIGDSTHLIIWLQSGSGGNALDVVVAQGSVSNGFANGNLIFSITGSVPISGWNG